MLRVGRPKSERTEADRMAAAKRARCAEPAQLRSGLAASNRQSQLGPGSGPAGATVLKVGKQILWIETPTGSPSSADRSARQFRVRRLDGLPTLRHACPARRGRLTLDLRARHGALFAERAGPAVARPARWPGRGSSAAARADSGQHRSGAGVAHRRRHRRSPACARLVIKLVAPCHQPVPCLRHH